MNLIPDFTGKSELSPTVATVILATILNGRGPILSQIGLFLSSCLPFDMKLHSFFRKFVQQATPSDWATLIYIVLTGGILLAGWNRLAYPGWHLAARLALLPPIAMLVVFAKTPFSFLKFLRDFYPLLLFGFFYAETDALNNLLTEDLDPLIAGFEQQLFGQQLSLTFSAHFPQRWFAELMHFAYFSFYLIIFWVLLFIWLKNRAAFQKSLFLISFSFYLYYLIFIAFPVAGPQFYFLPPDNAIPEGWLFGPIMRLVHYLGERPTAAFPSSHVGVTALVCVLSARYARPLLRWLLPLFFLLMLSTVYLKAHYVVDVAAGLLTAPLLGLAGIWVYHRITQRAPFRQLLPDVS